MDKSLQDIDAEFVKMHFDLKDKQDEVQKKTFVKWINSLLVQLEPPSTISDLSEDLRDGVVLLNLLKALTGEALQIEKGDRFGHVQRIHYINNVGNALQFLQDKQVKMVNIHAGDIVDGRLSIIMGLIWTLILHFQIEESTKHICSGLLEESDKLSGWRGKSEPKVVMLKWAQKTITEKYGIEVKDFGASWRNGVAFNALIHDVKPHMIDMRVVEASTPRENLERAFNTAEQHLGIPRLLDPEDVDVDRPDEKSIMTYVSKFVQKFPQNLQSCEGSGTKETIDKLARKIGELDGWVKASIESIQHEESEEDLQDLGSKLNTQSAVCQYLASEVNKLSQKVPYNFQVAALRDQMRYLMEQFKRAKEMKDAKIKALQDLNSLLEKHDNDMKMYKKWELDGAYILNKLDDITQQGVMDVPLEELESWKDHVTNSLVSNVLMENLETLDNTELQLNDHEMLKHQILEAFLSIKEIRENSLYKISMIEYNVEEENCIKLLKKIKTDLFEVEDLFKSKKLSHEKSLQALEEDDELVLRCRESLDVMTSICERSFEGSFKHEIESHSMKLQDLGSKVSELIRKIKNGALLYSDYLERKFQVVDWVDKVESYVCQLREADPELEEYETIHDDFKELMDEIGHQKANIEESKVLLQNLAFNTAWCSRVDDETNLLCDVIKRLEDLCSTSQGAIKASSIFLDCRMLKESIKEKIEVVGRNCLLNDFEETCDDIQAIKSTMEHFQKFESSISEVETLMEKGYALLKHPDAHKFLATFLKESFKFCCDLRNIARDKLAILKNSLELWQSYEIIKVKISRRSVELSSNKSQHLDYTSGMESLLGELDELEEVIEKLAKYVSRKKSAELFGDLESSRNELKKEIDSLNGGLKADELAARFKSQVCGFKELIEEWKASLSNERLNEDVNMERIPQLVHRTQTLVKELTTEGSSKISCLSELLKEIKNSEYTSEDVYKECLCAFEVVENSFGGFCTEMEDLHECTLSDADRLTRCGKIIVQVSHWLQSEKMTLEGFRDICEVEKQLERALDSRLRLENHQKSMADVESEASLVSEKNSINCLVCKLKDELETFKSNADVRFQSLSDLLDTWQMHDEIRNQIASMIGSISERMASCKSSLNQFSAGVIDGSLSDTLKIVMLDLQKMVDLNDRLKSITEKMLPNTTEEFQKEMWLESNRNEQIHESLANAASVQINQLQEMKEQFEGFVAAVVDCLNQVEVFNQELEIRDFLNDAIFDDQQSHLRVAEIFSNKLGNLKQYLDDINERKELFGRAIGDDVEENLLKIENHIGNASELMSKTTSFCRCFVEYKELMRCLKVCLAEFERNLMNGSDNKIDGEILILLGDGKKREELMKEKLSEISNLNNKSSECSLEGALEISQLMDRFESLRRMSSEIHDVELLLETLEKEVQINLECLHVQDVVVDAPESIKVLMEIVEVTAAKGKDYLTNIDRKLTEFGIGFTSNVNFLERFRERFENLKESVDDLREKLEVQHLKQQDLLEKLVSYEDLMGELETCFSTQSEKSTTSLDDIETKAASLQTQLIQLNGCKESLAAANEVVVRFSEDEDFKLFSRFLSICSTNFTNSMEKRNAMEMKLLNEIENLNVLSKHYDGFVKRVAEFSAKIETLIASIQMSCKENGQVEDNMFSLQEATSGLKTEIVAMDTSPDCCVLIELSSHQGVAVDFVASQKERLLEKLSRVENLIDSLLSTADRCQESIAEDQTDSTSNEMRAEEESLSSLTNGESITDGDEIEEVPEKLEGLQQESSASLNFDPPVGDCNSADVVIREQESSFLNEENCHLKQENLGMENDFEATQRLWEFVSRVEQQLELMRTQNVRSLNEAQQIIDELMLEGEKEEQEEWEGQEEQEGQECLPPGNTSCKGQLVQMWTSKKEELKMFMNFYGEEINRSNSLRNQLLDFKSWLEERQGCHSELCSGIVTCPQLEFLAKLKSFDSQLDEKANLVKNLSGLLNSIPHFEENGQLSSEGKAVIMHFHQLKDSTTEMLENATKLAEKIQDFQTKENKVMELMSSLKLKISEVKEKDKRLDEQMMEVVDIGVDLDVIQALVEQMNDFDRKDISDIDLINVENTMKTLRTDLELINRRREDVENELNEKSNLYVECRVGLQGLKKWIEEKEYLVWDLKNGHGIRCPIGDNFADEMSAKVELVEEMKRKMNSLNHEGLKEELNTYLIEIEALRVNAADLSALMRDQRLAEEEYFNGLIELRNCSNEIAVAFEGDKENNIQMLQFSDLNNINLADKLSSLVSCSSKVKFMLERCIRRTNNNNDEGEQKIDSINCLHLARLHDFEEMEKLSDYLESWILFQEATEKCCIGFKETEDDLHHLANGVGSLNPQQHYLQNLIPPTLEHQDNLNFLKTTSQRLEPVALASTSHEAKDLWHEIFANGRKLVSAIMHWILLLEEVSVSWNEFNSLYNEISEFLHLTKTNFESLNINDARTPGQSQEVVKSFNLMERKLASMMEAVLKVMTFLGGNEAKVKLEADVKELKEAFEKARIKADLELMKLNETDGNSSTDVVDGVTLLQGNELLELSRQRKELEIVLKDLDSNKHLIRKIIGLFKELTDSTSEMPPCDDDLFREHLGKMENSLGRLKKEVEVLKCSSGSRVGLDDLRRALFKLLDDKMDEVNAEVDCRKKEAEEHSDAVKLQKKEIEVLEYKSILHEKWLSEGDKMEANIENIENIEIFKLIEHEARSRVHDIFKMLTSLDLMTEKRRWRCRPIPRVDAGLLCTHVETDEKELISNATIQDDYGADNLQLRSSIAGLFNEAYHFWKKLRKHQVAKSSLDLLIDSKPLECFNQLEMAWKNKDVVEDGVLASTRVACYKDILEHLVILKLSVNSIDVSKRTISLTNVQAYLRKFSVIKKELLDLVPAIKKLSPDSPDRSPSDLCCIWEVLCYGVLSQIQMLGQFLRQANQIKAKLEEFKGDLSSIECHFHDLQDAFCTSSHLQHFEEMDLASRDLEKDLSTLLDECQQVAVERSRGCRWNIQNLQIEAVEVLCRIKRFSSDLDGNRSEFIKKLESWKEFSETSSRMLDRLLVVESSLKRTCKKCQLEDNIRLLGTTFSKELQDIKKTLGNLESERVKLCSNDDRLSSQMAFQMNSLKSIFERCKTKVFIRLKKLRQVSETIFGFDRSLGGFKGWVVSKESELNSPFKFTTCHSKEIMKTVQLLRKSQLDIEHKGRICSYLAGTCEVLCHDLDACPMVVEQDAVMATKKHLEDKWDDIVCLALIQKSKLEEVWNNWKKYFEDCQAARNVVTSVRSELEARREFENLERLDVGSLKEASQFYQKLILYMEGEHGKRDKLKNEYRQMALSLWVDEAGEMQAELEKLWSDWQETEHSIRLVGRRIGYHLDLFKMFQSSAVSLHEWLVGISTSLEQMEKSFEVDPAFNCRKNFKLIKKMKREVRSKLQEFNEVARSLDVVVVVDDDKRRVIEDSDDVRTKGNDNDGGIGTSERNGTFDRGAKELLENFSRFQSEILLRIKIMEKKMNHGVHEIVEKNFSQGSNVDEIAGRRPISSLLDKLIESSTSSKDDGWIEETYSTFEAQVLFLLLITAACLLPVSRIKASDVIASLTRR